MYWIWALKFELFFCRMQMNERMNLQGEQRILSIHLCSTSKEIQKKYENKEWTFHLDWIFLYYVLVHLIEANQFCTLSFSIKLQYLQEQQKISRERELMKRRNLQNFQNDILQRQREFEQRVSQISPEKTCGYKTTWHLQRIFVNIDYMSFTSSLMFKTVRAHWQFHQSFLII